MAMYLTTLGYVPERLAVEHALLLNGMKRRADIVAFGQAGEALLLVECKAPEIAISQNAVDQAARYNLTLGVRCVVLTNGMQHFCLVQDEGGKWTYATSIPQFSSLHRR